MRSLAASMKSPVNLDISSSVSLPTWPKSTSPTAAPPSITKMFAGCGSPWKNPWRKIIVIKVSTLRLAQRGDVEVGELHSLEELEHEHAPAGVGPVDPRDLDVGLAGEVAAEDLGVPRLGPVVELAANRARELVHHLLGIDEVQCSDTFLREAGGLEEQRDVRLDLARRVRALHLDRDALAVREQRVMDLADRSRRGRLLVELEEGLLDRQAKLLLNHATDVGERNRRDVVLQLLELDHDVGRDDVRSSREQLTELDEGRPQLVQHLPQPPPAV